MSPAGSDGPRPAELPRRGAITLAILAAFLWATYFGFVLGLRSEVAPLGLLVYPFLIGGAVYGLWAWRLGLGRTFLVLFGRPAQWGRAGLFLGIQSSVVVVTLRGSAVDAALLTLAGDVALTPLFVMAIFGEGRHHLRSVPFLAGIALSGGGASLTILAGGGASGLSGPALWAAPALPVFIAAYFISVAREGRRTPMVPVAGSATVLAGALALPATLVLPASVGALSVPTPGAGALLVGVGVTSFFLGPLFYFTAIGRLGIVLPALLMTGIPVFTLGIAFAVAGQVPAPLGLAGIPIAVAGSVLSVRGAIG